MSATRGRDVGAAPPHDLEGGVEQPPDLVGVGRLPPRPASGAATRAATSRRAWCLELCSSLQESYSDAERGGQQMAWDFRTDPEYQEKLDWVDTFVREEVEPLDLVFPDLQFVPLDEHRRRAIDPLKDEVRAPGAVGHAPGSRARRPGLRPAEARAAERDPRSLAVGVDRVRLPGARHRQRRDHRPLRHRGAEGAVPAAAARRRVLLLLLDDRAARRRRPARCSRPAR